MKRRTLISGILASAVALTGCAMGGKPAQPAAPTLAGSASPATGEITVWSWDVAATALKRLGAAYQKSHPGTTINVVDVGYDNAYDKISVGLQAGTGLPDLLTLETERLPGYLENFPNGFVDLSSRIDPVSGIEVVLPCSYRRADPMGACGPAGKQWEEAQPEKPKAKRGRSTEQKPQGVTLQ